MLSKPITSIGFYDILFYTVPLVNYFMAYKYNLNKLQVNYLI